MLKRYALAAACIAALFFAAFVSSGGKEHVSLKGEAPKAQRVLRLNKSDREKFTIRNENEEAVKKPTPAPDPITDLCNSMWRDSDPRCYG